MMVDDLGQYSPPPEKDLHWEVGVPAELPYTIAAAPFRGEHAEASAELLKVPIELQKPAADDEGGLVTQSEQN